MHERRVSACVDAHVWLVVARLLARGLQWAPISALVVVSLPEQPCPSYPVLFNVWPITAGSCGRWWRVAVSVSHSRAFYILASRQRQADKHAALMCHITSRVAANMKL